MTTITQIQKTNGQKEIFDKEKLKKSIILAAQEANEEEKLNAQKIASQAEIALQVFYKDKTATTQQIQDLIEKILIEENLINTAKHYTTHKTKQTKNDDKFTTSAIKILTTYSQQNKEGIAYESPIQIFQRVASSIAKADEIHKDHLIKETTKNFLNTLYNLEFLPNPTILKNAGTKNNYLTTTHTIKINHNLEQTFENLKQAILDEINGIKTYLDFSNTIPKSDIITKEQQSPKGIIPLLNLFNNSKNIITQQQNSTAIIKIDHPNILDFISAKDNENNLKHLNTQIGITKKFIDAVKNDEMYDLIDPITQKTVNSLHAKSILEIIATKIWNNGNPSIIFLDKVKIINNETTTTGAINIVKFIKNKKIDFEKLKNTVKTATHFLDNTITISKYKTKEIEEKAKKERNIGIGIIGFADALYKMEIPYNSEKAKEIATTLIKFIKETAQNHSNHLAKTRQQNTTTPYNNKLITIHNTKELPIIANVSPGISPNYALAYSKTIINGSKIIFFNEQFKQKIQELNIFNQNLIRAIIEEGSLNKINGIPENLKNIFKIATDIETKWQINIQSAFTQNTDTPIETTITFPAHATIKNITKAILESYNKNCKTIKIYREKSRKKEIVTKIGKNGINSTTPEDIITKNQTSLFTPSQNKENNKAIKEITLPPIKTNN